MKKNRVATFLILIALGIFLFFSLPEKKEDKSVRQSYFNRTVTMIEPPPAIKAKGIGSRTERFLDRVIWGTNMSVNRSIEYLAGLRDPTIIREAIDRINRYRRNRPSLAKDYIDLLAEMDTPLGVPVFLDCAEDPVEMIQTAAIKALSGCLSEESTSLMIRTVRSGGERLRLLCMENLKTRKAQEIYDLYRDLIVSEKDLRIQMIAIEGLMNYDSPECRGILHECLEDERLEIRTAAIKSLSALDDPAVEDILTEMMAHEGPIRRINAAKILGTVKTLPPFKVLENLARDKVLKVRSYLVNSLLAHLQDKDSANFQTACSVLRLLLHDLSPSVRLEALEGLYKAGEEQVALPYMQKLKGATGEEFAEAVEVVTGMLNCRQAIDILVERFLSDPGLSGDDRLAVLSGLASLDPPRGIELFFRVIRGEWDSQKTVLGNFSLDRMAAFRVHAFGKKAIPEWDKFLAENNSDIAAYLYVNGLRNLGDPDCSGRLLALAGDEERPLWIREEAVKSFCFLRDVSVGKELLEFHRECADKKISRLALTVYWNFF